MARKHPSGEPFQGKIGRTVAESTPWWPELPLPTGKSDIVLVVLDDSGFSHFGCYGSTIDTPNIDALASQGALYTGFHTTSLCSPTRACLLTGRNHHAVGMRAVSNMSSGFPHMRGQIPPSAATLPEVLRQAGYATFATGKWHLAPMSQCSAAGPVDNWPLQRGFDRYYGFLQGEADHFSPELTVDNHFADAPGLPEDGYHLSEDIVDQAMRMVRDSVSLVPEKPFFLYTAFGATHAPHQAPRQWLEKYRGRFDAGWDQVRAEWFARQLQMGVVPPGTQLAPRNPGVRPFADLTDNEQRFANRLQEAFAAMLDHTDHQIGRLVNFLREIGRLDNTLFIVMSDNGASQEGGPSGVLDEMKYFNLMPEDVDEAVKRLDDIGGPHSHSNIPWGWAQAGNTPLKWYKQDTHGGGIRDPLVIHWPKQLADPGRFRRRFCHVTDLMPTVLEIADLQAPEEFHGTRQMPLHGASLLPTLRDADADTQRGPQYFEMFGSRGIWHQGWKAVIHHRAGDDYDREPWELYHLDEDFSECADLAGAEPQKVKEMNDLWWAQAEQHGVLPLDDRRLGALFGAPPGAGLPTSRNRFVFYPPVSRIVSDACPPLFRGWTITVDLEYSEGDSGALVARGSLNSGCVLYLQQGQVVFDYNAFHQHTALRAAMPSGAGRHRITLQVGRNGRAGRALLSVNDGPPAEADIPMLIAMLSSSGMDIGRSTAPVCDAYSAPFEYPRKIYSVVFELPPRKGSKAEKAEDARQAEREEKREMGQQ